MKWKFFSYSNKQLNKKNKNLSNKNTKERKRSGVRRAMLTLTNSNPLF